MSGAAASLLVAGAAQAQTTASTIEEIVVTAQKRVENAQDVGISIQTMSSSTLEKLGVAKLQDIEFAAPSVSFGDGSEQGRYGIRGIVDYSRNAGYDSRVGVYIDGVYLGRSYLNNQTLLGVQQIDVLRGPQGTLFGKNTDAGVISITTRKAPSSFQASAEGDVGNFGTYRAAGIVGGPITDTLDAQFAVTKTGSDGYYHNAQLDKDNMGTDGVAARAQLRWRPTDKLEVNFSLDDLHDRNSTLHYTYRPTVGTDPYTFNSYYDDFAKRDSYGAAVTVDYSLDSGYQLTSITAWRGGAQYLDFNNETGSLDFLTAVFHEVTHQYSEELRIASPKTERYDWVAGLYFFDQVNAQNTKMEFGPAMTYLPTPFPLYAGLTVPSGSHVETKSYAAFVNGNFRVTPQLEIAGGLRYTAEKKEVRGFYALDPYGLVVGNFTGKSDDQATYKMTPKLGVNYHVTDNVLLFATVSRGFKSGGWNLDSSTASALAAGIKVAPETVTSYEAGVKSDFWNGRARVNATVFTSKFKDFQVFTFKSVQVGSQTVQVTSLTNAGEVTSKGLEFEGTVIPLDGLTLSATYTYNDSKYDKYPGGGGTAAGAIIDADGVQTPYAPKNKAYLSVDYTRPVISAADGFVHLGYAVQSSENFDPKVINPTYGDGYYIPGYESYDARLGLTATNGRWELSLWGKNLADDHHIKFANRTALLTTKAVLYDAPRTYGLTLKVNY
ncbi:TonB-dependent receptor [Phenylobacterium sp.]|uniref:TonB-dependent receptor n=1 Tax=Phenylobacterium sp. TaxID=1871053 RepID=UPI0035B3E492